MNNRERNSKTKATTASLVSPSPSSSESNPSIASPIDQAQPTISASKSATDSLMVEFTPKIEMEKDTTTHINKNIIIWLTLGIILLTALTISVVIGNKSKKN